MHLDLEYGAQTSQSSVMFKSSSSKRIIHQTRWNRMRMFTSGIKALNDNVQREITFLEKL